MKDYRLIILIFSSLSILFLNLLPSSSFYYEKYDRRTIPSNRTLYVELMKDEMDEVDMIFPEVHALMYVRAYQRERYYTERDLYLLTLSGALY